MMDCTITNTSACNREIGVKAPILQALCHAGRHLIHATQSHSSENSKDGAADFAEAATGIADAAADESTQHGGQRICPLCNECAFTIGHGHVEHIGTHQIVGGRTESSLREVSP